MRRRVYTRLQRRRRRMIAAGRALAAGALAAACACLLRAHGLFCPRAGAGGSSGTSPPQLRG